MSIRSSLESLTHALRDRGLRERGRMRRLLPTRGLNPEIALYDLIRSDNQTAPSLYHAGLFWEEINRDFRDLIWAGALENLRDEYFNERFAGTNPLSFQNYCLAVWLYYQKVREIDEDHFLETVLEPGTGGSRSQVLVSDRPMSLDFIQSVEEAYRIREAWRAAGKSGSPRIIVELGAGYGRLAYVCRKMLPDCSYVILDLPEALMCANSWLQRSLPGEVVPYDSARHASPLTAERLRGAAVWLLGAQRVEDLAVGSVDAFVNVYSFAEMPRASVDNYFSHIDRVTAGVLYMKQRKVERNAQDNCEIRADGYPVRAGWKLLYDRTSSAYEGVFERAYAIHAG